MTEATRTKFGDGIIVLALDEEGQGPPPQSQNGVVTVGNFDGVHRGHAALIRKARLLAQTIGGPVTAVTFDPHPLQLLDPERFQPQLTTVSDRARYLQQVGADAVVALRTTPALLGLGPAEFFRTVLIERFRARGIVEGFNFHFGHDREGTIATLTGLCATAGIRLNVVEPFQLDGATVSSSRIRDALSAGNVKLAAALMDRPYLVRGVVATGAQRGRTIGFPTANLEGIEVLLPADGVYAVSAHVGEQRYAGAANVGTSPTFGDNARKLEVHLIGFSGDLYGQTIAVEFMERLREVRRFNRVDELVEQMRNDVADATILIGRAHGG